MSLSRLKVWSPGEVLLATDLNSEFNNILSGGIAVVSPAIGNLDMDGNAIILDSDADTSIFSTTDDRIDFSLQGSSLFRFDGTAVTPVNGLDFVATATGSRVRLDARGSDSNIGIELRPKGTGGVTINNDTDPVLLQLMGAAGGYNNSILDVNGNEILQLSAIASAVCQLGISNAATGGVPVIQALGDDTDIDIGLTPKGTGGVNITLGALNEVQGSDIASAATLVLDTATGGTPDVTGTTGVTAITLAQGRIRRIRAVSAGLVFTHSSNLVMPGGVDYTTLAGDYLVFLGRSGGVVHCLGIWNPSASGAFPTGTVLDIAGSTVPSGWLECDGTAVSRTTYATLYAALGGASSPWGQGNGTTTFNLPDQRGRVRKGRGTGAVSSSGVNADVDTTTDGFTVAANNRKWITGMQVTFTLASGTITGLTSGNTYYVVRTSSTVIKLASSLANAQAGTVVDLTAKSSPVWTISHAYEARTLGEMEGEQSHAMSSTELLSHVHAQVNAGSSVQHTDAAGTNSPRTTPVDNTASAGGNAAMNLEDPYGVFITIIKA